jgi:hypothetical protein
MGAISASMSCCLSSSDVRGSSLVSFKLIGRLNDGCEFLFSWIAERRHVFDVDPRSLRLEHLWLLSLPRDLRITQIRCS